MVMVTAGCSAEPPTKGTASTAAGSAAATGAAASPDTIAFPDTGEEWSSIYMGGEKVGYAHSIESWTTNERGERVRQWVQEQKTAVLRMSNMSEYVLRISATENEAGQLLDFTAEMRGGPGVQKFRGQREGAAIAVFYPASSGQPEAKQVLRENGDVLGFSALEESLRKEPMQPGETRSFSQWQPLGPQIAVAKVELRAGKIETTELPGGKPAKLLSIAQTTDFGAGQPLEQTLWVDAKGTIVKLEMPLAQIAMVRTTAEEALAAIAPTKDLLRLSLVPLDRPIPAPYTTKLVQYRIHMPAGDPSLSFPSGGTQRAKVLDKHTIELVVRGLFANSKHDAAWPWDTTPPTAEERDPSQFIQSQDDAVVKLANEVPPLEDPSELAVALEKLVRGTIQRQDFTQAFASAADVARHRQGDCTEHAVLLAAVARARGLPARVVIGLVYSDRPLKGFLYHMWNEIWVGDHWMPYDATLGQGYVDAVHLKLAHSSLATGGGFEAFLPVMRVMGQVKIEVLKAE